MSDKLEHNNLIARWLSGDLSPDERADLEASGELDELRFVLDDVDTWRPPKYDIETGLSDLKEKISAERVTSTAVIKWPTYLRYAAAVLLAIGLYYTANLVLWSSEVQLTTEIGQQVKHDLPDGSTAHVAPLSGLRYESEGWEESRTLSMNGKVYFEVKKGSTFSVQSKHGTVTVLGTRFSVETTNQGFAVRCYEGKVKVSAGELNEILTKNQGLRLRDEQIERYEVSGESPSWLGSYSTYEDVLLATVVDDLKKYYDIDIQLPNKYAAQSFSGKVTHDDLELALRTIFLPLEITYTLQDQRKVVFD